MTTRQRIRDVAHRSFGHDRLLPGQADAAGALVDGHDVLLVSPTGAGKSLAYQAAGVVLGGCTVVVSPLLALQQDQIDGLDAAPGDAVAARLSSAESDGERRELLARAARGEIAFVFLAPEQLANDDVRRSLAELRPALVAVDEAHCVSVWGHDFRPDYFRLGRLIEDLGRPRIVAMTATAAPPVRDDIIERLGMRDPRTVVTGFARDNLRLAVARVATEEEQRQRVLETVREAGRGSGVVYCRTRPAAEEYAELLRQDGRRAAAYHAGLGHRRREGTHRAFMDDELDTIVATSAFGMGIDKPDIRFVVHAQVPESPDTYYQEVGRAGRDGEPAVGTLVYRPEDLSLGRFFSAGVPKARDVRRVVDAAGDADGSDPASVARRAGLGRRKAGRILNLLHLAGHSSGPATPEAAVDAVLELAEAHRRLERSRVEMMRAYAETDRCRAEFLVGYFGERVDRCGGCDNCAAGVAPAPADADDAEFPVQTRVEHDEFGPGVVTDVEEDRLTVLFENVGYRTLSLDVVLAEDLLRTSGHEDG